MSFQYCKSKYMKVQVQKASTISGSKSYIVNWISDYPTRNWKKKNPCKEFWFAKKKHLEIQDQR